MIRVTPTDARKLARLDKVRRCRRLLQETADALRTLGPGERLDLDRYLRALRTELGR